MRKPVVVKLGSSLVVDTSGRARRALIAARCAEISKLIADKTPVCVVSSGAIAFGLRQMELSERPRSIPQLQAASALGQSRLQRVWEEELARHGLQAAQILVTAQDIADRSTYLNARNALRALLGRGSVPIVNENDATATDEITFGDNDALAAQIAVLLSARVLILLTEADGVYTRAPGTPGATLIDDGNAVDGADLEGATSLGKGGMKSKVVAAEMAASAGMPTVIAAGHGSDVISAIVAGESRGTRFSPTKETPSAFKLWLRFGKSISGRLHIDAGAERAVRENGRSLLAVGVARCEGRFEAGDGVELVGPEGTAFGKGIAGASSTQIAERPRDLEAVHRDRLVIFD
ncbi:MAG: glutamate 5-kinase [Gaiellaceae bacterium]